METIVSKTGLPVAANEGQLRELGRLSNPEGRKQAYIDAVGMSSDEGRLVTARDIQTVVEKRRRCTSVNLSRPLPCCPFKILISSTSLQILDHLLLPAFDPAGEDHEEELPRWRTKFIDR
jgi:hypothetical protein